MQEIIPSPIQPFLDAYLNGLEPLRSHFYSLYIFGSIALGAFEERASDLDIIALTHGELTASELAQLKALHTQLMQTYQLGKRLEVLYIPLRHLGKSNREIAPYPYFHSRKFSLAGYSDLNYVTWWIVKNKSICLLGPEGSTLPFEVTWQDVLETMRDNLDDYWPSKAKHPHFFLYDGWIVFAVSTLCRILTTIEEGEIITKSAALTRWRDRLPPRWSLLIDEAWRLRHLPSPPTLKNSRWKTLIDEAWRLRHHLRVPSLYRSRLKRMREVLAFIEYVREREDKVLEVASQGTIPLKGDIK